MPVRMAAAGLSHVGSSCPRSGRRLASAGHGDGGSSVLGAGSGAPGGGSMRSGCLRGSCAARSRRHVWACRGSCRWRGGQASGRGPGLVPRRLGLPPTRRGWRSPGSRSSETAAAAACADGQRRCYTIGGVWPGFACCFVGGAATPRQVGAALRLPRAASASTPV